jgi:flagellin
MATYNYLVDPIGANQSQQSFILQQLSSGNRIFSSWIDAGGMAVSTKLDSAISRSSVVVNNLATTNSFLQTQDGILQSASEILDRMGQLKAMSEGVFGDATGAYQTEFTELSKQLSSLSSESFNGVQMFSDPTGSLSVMGNESGSVSFEVSQANIESSASDITSQANLADVTMANITDSLQNVANLRATNGAQQSRVGASFDLMKVNYSNYSLAYSTIMDVDWAQATTDYTLASLRTETGVSLFSNALTTGTTVNSLLS